MRAEVRSRFLVRDAGGVVRYELWASEVLVKLRELFEHLPAAVVTVSLEQSVRFQVRGKVVALRPVFGDWQMVTDTIVFRGGRGDWIMSVVPGTLLEVMGGPN